MIVDLSKKLSETVEKQETEVFEISDYTTESGQEFVDPEGSGEAGNMGCGASSQSNVLLEAEAGHATKVNPQHSAEKEVENISTGDSVNGTSGVVISELTSSQPGQQGDAVPKINMHSEPVAEKKSEGQISLDSKRVEDVAIKTVNVAITAENNSKQSFSHAAGSKQIGEIAAKSYGGDPITSSKDSWTDEPKTLDEQITELYAEILNGVDVMTWDVLSRNTNVLSNWLVALGIGQDSMKFISDAFKDFRSVDISLGSFQQTLKRELEISRKLLWVTQTGLLRCIAESLPPAKEESDPLSGLRILDKGQVLALVQAMHHQLAECLVKSVAELPIADAAPGGDGQSNNSKFCVDPKLFKMK